LPIGLAQGCRLRRDIPKDAVLTYEDVEIPAGRLIDELRREQDEAYPVEVAGRLVAAS
jgi:predicted homoserine dehydrogenase-like protein